MSRPTPLANTEDVRRALQRFAEGTGLPEAVVLTGAWGVGKTYLWNEVLEASNPSKPKYAYVSLFGCASIPDLRDRLIESVVSLLASPSGDEERPQREGWARKLDSLREKGLFAVSRSLVPRQVAKRLKSLPVLQNYGPFYRSVMYEEIRDVLVVLDDFERRGSTLEAADVLAEIADLRETRSCRVLLVLNEDQLSKVDRDELRRLEEKVFDARVNLDPSPTFAADVAIPIGTPHREIWQANVESLRLNNIRVLKRAYSLVQTLVEVFGPQPEQVQAQFIAAIVLFVTCRFAGRTDLPTLDFVRGYPWNRYRREAKQSEDGATVEEDGSQRWSAVLDQYGWQATDELDLELINFVENGYPSHKRLEQELARSRGAVEDALAHAAIERPWDRYHGSLVDDEEQLVAEVEGAYRTHMRVVSPMTMDAAIRLLRHLGRDDIAETLGRQFVEEHRHHRETIDLKENAFGDRVTDLGFRALLDQATQGIPVEKDLQDVLTRISRDKSWGSSDTQFLASLPSEDFEEFFRGYRGRDLSRLIEAALMFGRLEGGSDQDKAIGGSARDALARIAGENRLNAYRLHRFGVVPKSPAQSLEAERMPANSTDLL